MRKLVQMRPETIKRRAEKRRRERPETLEEFQKIARDCKIQGHHWDYYYGGRSRCRWCHIEA